MSKKPNEIMLADVAKEVGGDVIIEFHTLSVKLTCDQLQTFKLHGLPTDPMTCFQAVFLLSGKTQEELQAYMKEANASGGYVSVSFEAPEGGVLNIKSKGANPMFDEIVQMVEGNRKTNCKNDRSNI